MAKGPQYKVPHRRRREKKTDYKKRLELLKSGKPRAVVRESNNHMRVQLVLYNRKDDKTQASAFSGDLEEFGWEHHTGNLPAAYLTGFLAGKRALEEGLDEAVVDIGLQNNHHGSRIYSAIKGLVDAGMDINADGKAFPSEERCRGEHIEEFKNNGITENFEEVKSEIEG
ncbi:MAG: 50S ribosomal protein L18 [Candidatus Nanohaloarchaeota archaeon QJJ-9]|nr:50S ribosomal protein L18 [Candidatus Nanohaloarchaeota archaeon QJJ-9]